VAEKPLFRRKTIHGKISVIPMPADILKALLKVRY
jgi:hypothetical protein